MLQELERFVRMLAVDVRLGHDGERDAIVLENNRVRHESSNEVLPLPSSHRL